MRRKILFFLFIAAILFSSEEIMAKDVYYVQSLKARIMSAPSFKSNIVGEVSKGTKISSTGREGSWLKVMYQQKEGYISSILVAAYPPMEKQSLIKGEEADIKQSVRRRASTYTSAAAARGLTQDDRRRLSRDEKTDYQGLEKMESLAVSDEEIVRFMEGEKL